MGNEFIRLCIIKVRKNGHLFDNGYKTKTNHINLVKIITNLGGLKFIYIYIIAILIISIAIIN